MPRALCKTLIPCLWMLLMGSAPLEAQPEDLESWLSLRSSSFELITDAPPEAAIAIADQLERFRSAFARLAPGIEMRSQVPARFLAFNGPLSYAAYKRPSHPRILGQYLSSLDGHYLTLDAAYAVRTGYRVVFHEFVHYLVDSNMPGVPRWFHEGLAEYYSTFTVRDGVAIVGLPVEDHVLWIRRDSASRERVLDHDLSLLEVLSGEAAHSGATVGRFYSFSWALVHYLLSGDEGRLAKTADFLARVQDREDPEDAFEAAFNVRLDDLEEELRSYIEVADFEVARLPVDVGRSELRIARVPAADVLVNLGDLSAQLGYLESANSHYRRALEHRPRHPDAHAGLALMRDADLRWGEAETLYRDALRLGSREPRTYLRFGRHLLARQLPEDQSLLSASGKLRAAAAFARPVAVPPWLEVRSPERVAEAEKLAAEARAVLARALEIEPDHAGVQVYFGIAHLYGGEVDPRPGIRALESVRRWLPANRELAFFLLQLHLKRNDFKAARGLLEGTLGDREPAMTLAAREEIERAELIFEAAEALADGRPEDAASFFDRAIEVTSSLELRARMSEVLASFEAQRTAG
ncbi:MAG: DUF1570 domain-containing protein [Acidobacteriota bacterium]